MSRDTIPGFPRKRLPSHRDEPEERVPESVFLALQDIRTDMAVNTAATDLKIAKLTTSVENFVASGRHETAKIIAGVVIAALGVIGGQRALAPSPTPEPVRPPARTALDIRLDTCRPMAPGPSREDCFARVIAETDH